MSERNIRDILEDDGHKSGIWKNILREQYSSFKRMNFSTIKTGMIGDDALDVVQIRKSFEGSRPPPTRPQQDSFDAGTLAHLMLLQPELLLDRVAVWKGGARAGNEWDACCLENKEKMIVRERDHRDVQAAVLDFKGHKAVRDILRGHDTELAVLTKEGPIYCKGLIDAVNGDGVGTMVDPKTSRNGLSEHEIKHTIRKFRYVEQMATYRRWYQRETGNEISSVNLLFLSLPPAQIGIAKVRLHADKLEQAEDRMVSHFQRLEECLAKDAWPTFYAEYDIHCEMWELDDVNVEGAE